MKNRFGANRRDFSTIRELLLPVLIFAFIAGLFLYGLGTVGQVGEEERLRSVTQAVTKATVQCYAVEGAYAPSLAYLEERYGLRVDREKYVIQYDIFASNIMPTILVLPNE